ncbi:MAG: response regulator [Pseudomonadales bacterium]
MRLLLVEDADDDAELILRELRREGMSVSHQRVDTENDLRKALNVRWDVVISDFSMPRFDGLQAHSIVKAWDPTVPFIFVSGVLGEERAVEAMRAGAKDYVLKGDLRRLGPVVYRALAERDSERRRRAAELALEFQRRRYQSIFETAPVALVEVDLSGAVRLLDALPGQQPWLLLEQDQSLLARVVQRVRVLAANEAAALLLGAERSDSLVRPVTLRPGSIRTWIDILSAVAQRRGRFMRELLIERVDGTQREVLLSFQLPGTRAELRNVVMSMVDVSERNSLERQVRAAQRMETVGRLASGVAHDFNNILTVIRGYVELIGEQIPQGSRLREDLNYVDAAAQSAERLTRQLLAFSRGERGEPRVLHVNDAVAQLEKMLLRLLGEDIELSFRPGDDVWAVRIDPTHLEQVLMNLAINARDAMPEGGRLSIETANRELDGDLWGAFVEVTVADSGHGMDEATLQSIFEPFFTTKEIGRGTGLGLSTVHGIVRQAGGSIQVTSDIGQGATFRIYLPRCLEPEPSAAAPQPTIEVTGGRERVLLVEDDELVRKTAERMLTGVGYRVVAARNGEQALTALERHPDIAAMVTDVIMPGMSGRELAVEMLRRRPGLRILFVSGYPSNSISDQDLMRPGTDYLEKPYDARTLLRRLRVLLDA